MVLVGRHLPKLEIIAQDLAVRSPNTKLTNLTVDFNNIEAIKNLVEQIYASGVIDIVLIAHGSLPDQQTCQNNLKDCEEAILVNGLSPILFVEAFAKSMETNNHGTIAVIGSVAGDRGRKSNYIYGAAKGLVARYVQGLQHRLASTNVKAVLIKPGPTDTPMTAHLKQTGTKLASVETVAQNIVNGIEKRKSVIYAPAKWALIMLVIQHLPNFIFNKLNI